MRFLHCADLHLGKPFGRFDEDTRAALKAARLEALRQIGQLALDHQAPLVLIAGDCFDAEAPPSKLVKRALDVMAGFETVHWVLMPGNHDSLTAIDLWERISRDKPDNLTLALTPEPILLGEEAAILPAPPTARSPGHDLTQWMVAAQTGTRLRIGLAHGGVTDFGSEEGGLAIIPPDRAASADLDYLALGDWHGQMAVTPQTWYAGAPEADGFKNHAPAGILLVDLAERGAMPNVTPLPVGQFHWQRIDTTFFTGHDPVQILEDALPDAGRDRTLVRFYANGSLGLSELMRLRDHCAAIADEFHHFEPDLTAITVAQNVDDLDQIATSGALRSAAQSLLDQTSLHGRSAEEAQIAQMALSHLFALARQDLS